MKGTFLSLDIKMVVLVFVGGPVSHAVRVLQGSESRSDIVNVHDEELVDQVLETFLHEGLEDQAFVLTPGDERRLPLIRTSDTDQVVSTT